MIRVDITDFALLTPEERKKKRASEEKMQEFKGSVKLFRDIQNTELWRDGDGTLLKVYIFCLLRANVGKMKKYLPKHHASVGSGEFVTGRLSGGKHCHMSDKTFNDKMKLLAELGLIKQVMKQNNRKVTVLHVNEPFDENEREIAADE